MQIATVGVDETHLLSGRLHHVRVTVTHVGHIIDAIKVLFILLAVHVLATTTDNLNGILLEKERHRATKKTNNALRNGYKTR